MSKKNQVTMRHGETEVNVPGAGTLFLAMLSQECALYLLGGMVDRSGGLSVCLSHVFRHFLGAFYSVLASLPPSHMRPMT